MSLVLTAQRLGARRFTESCRVGDNTGRGGGHAWPRRAGEHAYARTGPLDRLPSVVGGRVIVSVLNRSDRL